ncbi:MAG: hypothetical protein ACXVCY_06835 [Pseudobdellovibrionaceae bacterium]
MVKTLIVALGMALSFNAFAAAPSAVEAAEVIAQVQMPAIMDQAHTMGIDWKVGDAADYSIDMGFIKGTMTASVRSIGAEGIWMDQNMDLGFAGKQKVETLIDQNTGAIKKMLVNGQEQQIPENNMEVVEVKEDRITVPAGTFDCIHARLKDTKENKETNAWVNPQLIPMSGMLKQVAPTQFGDVTVLLKSFKKN